MATWQWICTTARVKAAMTALMLCLASAALAEPKNTTANPIEAVIQNQITAFQADDFDGAFALAAPNIQRLFGNATRFAQMIVNQYPMVWRPADVQYLSLIRSGPYALQRVMIADQNNVLHLLVYQLEPIDQQWRISGVQILALPGEPI